MLFTSSFVEMFNTKPRMLFDAVTADFKKFLYSTQLELIFTKLYKHIDINDMPKNANEGKEDQCT
jgi:hypothetical protein